MGSPPAVGSTLAGYRLDAVLGRGGMGVVFRAEQPELRRQVAVKVIAPDLARDDAFRERFKRESRLAAAIEHPNAIPIYEAGTTEDGTLYLAMRYVDGTDLHTLIQRGRGLEPARVARLVEQVAGALDEAHALGLVHRDVKPANVLVATRRGKEQAFLTDFGLTKPVMSTSGVTGTGQWLGTLDYTPPEQIEGRPVDARADVYALGCVLFEALTGRVPFDKPNDVAKLYAHANEAPPRVSDHVAGLSSEVDQVVARAMAKDRGERYPSAGDLGHAAAAAVRGEALTIAERIVATGEAAPATADAARADAQAAAPSPAETQPLTPVPGPADAETQAQRPVAAEGPAPAEAPTRAVPGDSGPPRRRRPRWVALLGVVLLAAGAAAAVLLLGGGDGVEYERIETPAYSVEVPADWEQTRTEEPGSDPQGPVLRTELASANEQYRLIIARRPELTASPDQQADLAETEGEANLAQFEPVSREPATVAGQESVRFEFTHDDEDLGDSITVAYFLAESNGAYRIQVSTVPGTDREERADEVALHAAETLEP